MTTGMSPSEAWNYLATYGRGDLTPTTTYDREPIRRTRCLALDDPRAVLPARCQFKPGHDGIHNWEQPIAPLAGGLIRERCARQAGFSHASNPSRRRS